MTDAVRAAARDTLLPLLGAAAVAVAANNLKQFVTKAAAVFAVTAAWDIVLGLLARGELSFFGAESWGWVRGLRRYFQYYTWWQAAAIAGAVGVLALSVIQLWEPKSWKPKSRLLYFGWVLVVSAAIGLPMRIGGWFTMLQNTYYNKHPWLTVATDAMSGAVVLGTVYVLGL